MRAFSKAQTPIVPRGILKRNPKPHRTRRIRVQKRAILMRRHPPSNLGLLANNHALEHSWISEPYRFGNLPMQWCECGSTELRRQFVQVVADFVYSAVLWFGQFSGAGECVFFEEEADFVAAGEEVVVADVRVFFSG